MGRMPWTSESLRKCRERQFGNRLQDSNAQIARKTEVDRRRDVKGCVTAVLLVSLVGLDIG